MAPPPGPLLPTKVDAVIVVVPTALTMAPPPYTVAVLLVNVVLSTLEVFSMKSAPPSIATLPENVLVVIDSDPLLAIAPPEVPLSAGD